MPDTIEAEVLEIDGSPPPAAPEPAPPRHDPPWQAMRGKVLRLDRRWWPLWVLLGIVAVILLATVGVVVGVLLLCARIVSRILRALVGGSRPQSGTSLSRSR